MTGTRGPGHGIVPGRPAGHGAPRVLAQARWPEPGDGPPPPLPGFVHSAFAPLVAAAAGRCLERRPSPAPVGARCAVVLVSAAGDRPSATHVRSTVAAGGRVGPLFFFQSVPNSVAGQVAARWGLTGPVVCLSPTGDPRADAIAEGELLLYDGDADEALLVLIEEAPDATPTGAVAVLLGGGDSQ